MVVCWPTGQGQWHAEADLTEVGSFKEGASQSGWQHSCYLLQLFSVSIYHLLIDCCRACRFLLQQTPQVIAVHRQYIF